MTGNGVSVHGLAKAFRTTRAVDDVSFEVEPGELVSLLGPSGCGKTTTLRMIGGLAEPTAGSIRISGRDVTSLNAWQRNCGFVFQSYALFPHMTVQGNIAYGLRVRGWRRGRVAVQVERVARLLGIGDLLQRRPKQLSGGQQQRVAVARALAIEPEVMLMDEPLANLDAQLRDRIRFEIRKVQRETGVTIIYVTHDQSEAFALSDKVVVMNAGRIEQIGSPKDIYATPRNAFVAGFIGSSNLVTGRVVARSDGHATFRWGDLTLEGRVSESVSAGSLCTALIRSNDFLLVPRGQTPHTSAMNILTGAVDDVAYLGTHYRLGLHTGAGRLVVELTRADVERDPVSIGDEISVGVKDLYIMPAEDGGR